MTRREFRDLADPETVVDALDALDVATDATTVPLQEARGRVLAARVDADVDVPGFDRAAMDGYAVRAADTVGASEADPVELAVVGTVHAGEAPTASLDPGASEAIQVATGAVLPSGADAVVPVERTDERGGAVEVRTAVPPGDSVMPHGADIASGERALGPGTRLGPRHLGVLAALGRETVPVRGRPRVGVLSTGEELVEPGDTLRHEAGQIYDVNSATISAAVESAGGDPRQFRTVSDDPADIRETLAEAASVCDLVVTSGSTSAGTADVLHRLVEDHGETLVHGVALKPGRPMLVGRVFGTAYVGLPGYPVSALTVFRAFVAPRLRAAAGQPDRAEATARARLATRVRYDGGRLRLVPVGLVGDGTGSLVAYAPSKGSGATTSLVETDGVVRMAPEINLLARGDSVTVERFDPDDPLPALLAVGEPDPLLFDVLDGLDAPRFLSLAPRDAIRWLRDDVPDVVVTSETAWRDADVARAGDPLARWTREWGLVVPAANPADVAGVGDLADGDCRFVNLADDLALRDAFDSYLADREDGERTDETTTGDGIVGYSRGLPGLESAARTVVTGNADAGLGLRATAASLDLEFVPLGTQRLVVVPNEARLAKDGVESLADAVTTDFERRLADRPGYEAIETPSE